MVRDALALIGLGVALGVAALAAIGVLGIAEFVRRSSTRGTRRGSIDPSDFAGA